MMRRRLLPLLLLLAACDQRVDVGDLPSRDAGVGDAGAQLSNSLRDVCDRFYAIQCAASPSCCSHPERVYDTEEACIAGESQSCVTSLGNAEALRTGALEIDPTGLPAFYAEIQRRADTCYESDIGTAPPLRGTLPSGADCSHLSTDVMLAYACAGNQACIVDRVEVNPNTRRMVAHCGAPIAQGQSCVVASDGPSGCGNDGWCDGQCQPRRSEGQSCEGTGQCVAGLVCSGSVCSRQPMNNSGPPGEAYCLLPAQVCANYPGESLPDGACAAEWQCSDRYRVECTPNGGGELDCRCLTNTIPGASFTSVGFCSADVATRAAAARESCGFSI